MKSIYEKELERVYVSCRTFTAALIVLIAIGALAFLFFFAPGTVR